MTAKVLLRHCRFAKSVNRARRDACSLVESPHHCSLGWRGKVSATVVEYDVVLKTKIASSGNEWWFLAHDSMEDDDDDGSHVNSFP